MQIKRFKYVWEPFPHREWFRVWNRYGLSCNILLVFLLKLCNYDTRDLQISLHKEDHGYSNINEKDHFYRTPKQHT